MSSVAVWPELGNVRLTIRMGRVAANPGEDIMAPKSMAGLGVVVLIVGIIGMFLAAHMDTSVRVGDVNMPSALRPYVPNDMRVNNLGLMQEKQNYFILSGVVAVIGAILLAAGWIRFPQTSLAGRGDFEPEVKRQEQ